MNNPKPNSQSADRVVNLKIESTRAGAKVKGIPRRHHQLGMGIPISGAVVTTRLRPDLITYSTDRIVWESTPPSASEEQISAAFELKLDCCSDLMLSVRKMDGHVSTWQWSGARGVVAGSCCGQNCGGN